MKPIVTLAEVLAKAEPRPREDAASTVKKNYAERFSRGASAMFANSLRPHFPGILPHQDGTGQESTARTAKGFKKLDVNYSTPELGLGLGVSLKTLNFRDGASQRYTKNYTRIDNELRAEAMDYHVRQPWAVLIAIIYIPADACDDGKGDNPSSFGGAVRSFRNRSGRKSPEDMPQLFEAIFIGLYEYEGKKRGTVTYFDVMQAPPKAGPPAKKSVLSYEQVIASIVQISDLRNNPPFEWA